MLEITVRWRPCWRSPFGATEGRNDRIAGLDSLTPELAAALPDD
ncbi:hypothetical protein [Streptomyces pseudogriseolus]